MKILIVHNRYRIAGGEDVVVQQEAVLLRDSGHDVSIWLTSSHEYLRLPRWQQAIALFWNSAMYRRLRERMRADRPDVVHIHNTYPLISPAVIHAARAEGVPVVMTVHNYRLCCLNAYMFRNGEVCRDCLGRTPWRGVWNGCYRSRPEALALSLMLVGHRWLRTWDMVDVFIALTDFSRDILVRTGVAAERIVVKPNCVLDPGTADDGRSGERRALYVGRLTPEKGVRTLLDAWKRLGAVLPLDIVGDKQLPDGSLFQDPELPGVRMLGQRSREDVLDLMRRAFVLVVPSLWYEGMPMVCLEAFAVGTPVIASDLGALPDILGDSGLVFQPGNAADLERQVRHLLENPGLAELLGAHGRREYVKRYAPQRNCDALVDVYERAGAVGTKKGRV